MNFAIFWLPIFGGGILWAIAISAWFSPDKQIPAVWFAFAGSVCLLVTVALQAHLYVATFVVQPKVTLEGPPAPSHFRWEPAIAIAPIFKAPSDQVMVGQSVSPRFRLLNTTSIFASDLSIEWTAPDFDSVQLINSSAQLAKYVSNIAEGHFTLTVPLPSSPAGYPVTYSASHRAVLSIPFLNRPAETYLPIEVWSRGMILLFAWLPDRSGNETFDIEFRATVSWNIPDRGKPQMFAVIAHVRNTKREGDSAIMDADVSFEVKPL